ncbi:DoxX family protein [Agromyces albus]|uniref:DoxX family protein n=1 Tax=Agromyces albus TaxID=205332 RepID=UPI002787B595|nr:DoxX family protein [Agromyces albus]MDQ0575521.1 putative oxidoreductase [Agromyces albus]
MSSISAPTPGLQPVGTRPAPVGRIALLERVHSAEAMLKSLLERWSAPALRIALGTVFVVFGVLKFFPGVSPVESLVTATWGVLTFGVVGGQLALVLTAAIETVAGLALISGVFARFGLVMLAVAFVGIFSPLVFFPAELFADGGPTLLGQYVLKNIVLVAAALVVASRVLHGPSRSSRSSR